jgi:hypothetical protein
MAFSGAPRPRALLPLALARYDAVWMQRVFDVIAQLLLERVSTREAAPAVLLLSPSAKVFRVTVSDTGVLTATEVPQGDPLA